MPMLIFRALAIPGNGMFLYVPSGRPNFQREKDLICSFQECGSLSMDRPAGKMKVGIHKWIPFPAKVSERGPPRG